MIEGGSALSGIVKVQGSKNAALPVIAATILCPGENIIENVPDILDVRNFLSIMGSLGAEYEWKGHTLRISTDELKSQPLPEEPVKRLRGSVLLLGPLLARFGEADMAYPGGDAIGARPIDVHLDGFRKMGAKVQEGQKWVRVEAEELGGEKIVLGVTSVTGTENLILAAMGVAGKTEISMAATEPHVQNLCNFLKTAGADIKGIGTPILKIAGNKKLRGVRFRLCPDEIETVTFCVAAAATRGEVTVQKTDPKFLDAPLNILEKMGVNLKVEGEEIKIGKPEADYKAVKIVTGVYPQLLTDYHPLLGVLATQAVGETSVHDWIYEGRQGYLAALKEMGIDVDFDDVHRSRIRGPTELRGAQITAPDIRAGASILLAALVAKGESVLYNAEILDRGYERLDERLNSLGAKIKRIE